MKLKPAAVQGLASLYHYDRFEDPTRLERIVSENTIYCSNPNDFNDPWDCKPCFSKALLDDPEKYELTLQWFVWTSKKLNPSIPDAEHERRIAALRADRPRLEWMIDQATQAMTPAILAQYRVYCLSTHADLPLMWSHYTGSHRGYCLEFSVKNELFCGALPVEYVDHYPELDLSDNSLDGALRVLLTKSNDWSYENEYRLITAAPGYSYLDIPTTRDNLLPFPAGSLKAIIMGCRMPESAGERVRALVAGAGRPITLKAAHRIPDRYSLEIRLVE
jgi:hypothetical protein